MTSPDEAVSRIPYGELGAIGEYLLACRDDGLRPRTIVIKYQRLRAAEGIVGDLLAAGEDQVATWWRHLAQSGVSNRTRATYLSHLNAFYAWAVLHRRIEASPTRRVRRPRSPHGLPRDLDPRPVLGALEQLAGADALMVGLALWCGLRCAEIARIRPCRDVIVRQDGRPVLRVTGKGGHTRMVSLPGRLTTQLAEAGTGWALPARHDARRHVSADWVSRRGAAVLRAAGIPATMHQLRHTHATVLLQATRDLSQVAHQLGHANVASAQIYARARPLDPTVVEGMFTATGTGDPDPPDAGPPDHHDDRRPGSSE